MGLKNIQPKLSYKTKTDNKYHHFGQWYTLNIDRDINEFKIQEDEVEEIKWFSPEEAKKYLQEHPEEFTPSMKKYFELFF